ncbi:MAG: hypothetical protein AB1452_18540, partial [Pseudomonadota bacterium]
QYMVNPSAPARKPAAGAPARSGKQFKTVGDVEIHLGFISAAALRKALEGTPERTMHGGVPSGTGWFHLNVTLLDAAGKAPIQGAKVQARVEQAGMSGETKPLEPVTLGGVPSYGAYFRLLPRAQYAVTVRAQKPETPQPLEARFEHRSN